MKEDIIKFALERLQEPSTWRGVIWLITAFGFALDPSQREAIVTTGMSLVGLIGVFTSEHKKQVQEVQEQQVQKTEVAVEEFKKKPSKPKKPKGTDKDNFFNDK